jgi:DNA-binding Lrp family transcriptional regulator
MRFNMNKRNPNGGPLGATSETDEKKFFMQKEISPVIPDNTDFTLLNTLQDDIPLVERPFEYIGRMVGISEDEVIQRLNRLSDAGLLRNIVPTLESDWAGPFVSTLIAIRVPDRDIARVALIVNGYHEVSHNFRRDNEYNLWFTLAAPSYTHIEKIIEDICHRTGISPDNILDLRTQKKYKIDVRFPILRRGE